MFTPPHTHRTTVHSSVPPAGCLYEFVRPFPSPLWCWKQGGTVQPPPHPHIVYTPRSTAVQAVFTSSRDPCPRRFGFGSKAGLFTPSSLPYTHSIHTTVYSGAPSAPARATLNLATLVLDARWGCSPPHIHRIQTTIYSGAYSIHTTVYSGASPAGCLYQFVRPLTSLLWFGAQGGVVHLPPHTHT